MAVGPGPASAVEDETLQILASSVYLRSNGTLLDAIKTALNLSKYSQAAAPDDHGNTFRNVHYYSDSEPSTPTFFNCKLENVDFIQCKFRDTEFYNLTLTNVTFLYVDCNNVSVGNLSLRDCMWKLSITQNAFLVHNSTIDTGNTRTTTLEPSSPLTSRHFEENTIIATRRIFSVTLEAAIYIKRYEKEFQAFVLVTQSPQHGTLLARLMDHKHIVSLIVDYCVNEDDTSFTRERFNSVVTFRNRAELNSASKTVHVFCPDSTQELCLVALALLYASTERPTMVCESLHGPFRRIQRIVSRPQALNFRAGTSLVLHYRFEGGSGLLKTDDQTWHSLMKYVRHGASHIKHIHLLVDKGFWNIADWMLGPIAVLTQTSLRNCPSQTVFTNFLAEIAKIAAPAHRWRYHGRRYESDYDSSKDPDHTTHGTVLQITIDGIRSKEQQTFVRRLEWAIRRRRRARPLFYGLDRPYTRDD